MTIKEEFADDVDRLLNQGYDIKFSRHPTGSNIVKFTSPQGEVTGYIQYPDGTIKRMSVDEQA